MHEEQTNKQTNILLYIYRYSYRPSITSIENFSNEFFYEIFDYLDGYDIHNAFSNLNNRIQQLLNSSCIQFKIKIHPPSNKFDKKVCEQIKLITKHQIFSLSYLHLPKQKNLFSSFSIDKSLDRLESLTLKHLNSNALISILLNLSDLPRLFSLTIDMLNILKDLTNIYRTILALPFLKYFNFSIGDSDLPISLSTPTNKQFSPIEYLVMNHPCSFKQISTVISYTPQLRSLYFSHTTDQIDLNIETISLIDLSNLTNLSICLYQSTFDAFEILINKISSKLKVLRVNIYSEDIVYLNANRWKKLILQYFPQMEKFYLDYCQRIDYENESLSSLHTKGVKQFNSSFWTKRQWTFQVKIDHYYETIRCSIQPIKKQWFEPDAICSSYNRLIVDLPSIEYQELLIMNINRILSLPKIYHIEILKEKIFIGVLIKIIDLLSELNSLKINSLSLNQTRGLYEEEIDILCSTEDTSKIKNVYLETVVDMSEIYFIMTLCPYMNYLKINSLININVELFIRNILNKINFEKNKYLRLLCVHIPTADEKLIKKLNDMINIEKLIENYTMKRVDEYIYLKWN